MMLVVGREPFFASLQEGSIVVWWRVTVDIHVVDRTGRRRQVPDVDQEDGGRAW